MPLPQQVKDTPLDVEELERRLAQAQEDLDTTFQTQPTHMGRLTVATRARSTQFKQLPCHMKTLAVLSIIMAVVGIVLAVFSCIQENLTVQTGAVLAIAVFGLLKELYFVVEKLQEQAVTGTL